MADERDTFLEAAESFADLVDALPADLSGPGLGSWDLRALVGHTSRSLVTVSDYLKQPVDRAELESPADYFMAISGTATDPGVAARGVQAGAALGDDPAGAVRRLLETVADDLVAADLEQPITTFAGGARLRDYLPTRTFELVVHSLDISVAVPVRWAPPPEPLRSTVALAGEVAVRRGDGSLLLRLVTGREPGGFSIV